MEYYGGPGIKYKKIGKINKNEYIEIYAQIDDWYVIKTEDNIVGTVSSKYIELVEEKIENDILMVIKPLNGVFLPINKHGKQSRQSFRAIEEAFAGNDPIMIFPAGLVSRKGKGGEIADLKWQKMFVNKSIEYHRNVIPMYFDGKNSPFFYNFAKLRSRLGLKFNIEMIYLPREMVRSENAKYTISIGSPILWESLCPTSDCDAQHRAEEVRAIVYGLKEESHRK